MLEVLQNQISSVENEITALESQLGEKRAELKRYERALAVLNGEEITKKRRLSEEGRKNISEAQQRRWENIRSAAGEGKEAE